MRYPGFINKGDTIAFVSPSFSPATEQFRRECFENSLKLWKKKGFKTEVGFNAYEKKGVGISNVPEECARELMESYVNQSNKALISTSGGELMCEILPFMDFDEIKKAPPKWFMGFSDNTNFTFLLTTMCDVASIYGPNGGSFGMKKWHPYLEDALGILTGESLVAHNYDFYEIESLKNADNPFAELNCTEETEIKCYLPYHVKSSKTKNVHVKVMLTDEAEFEGRLLGGCLDCLVNMVGTKYDYVNRFINRYVDDGIIWYLEACDLNVFSIRRAMWQLEQAGWFRNAKGFIFGRPLNGDKIMNLNKNDAVLPTTCIGHSVPVILDADIGHLPPSMPLINGALCKVQFKDGTLVVDMGVELS
ncbi:MAG: LD-carboxypeptidase [Lachnospiraceae bacterium]|nr:LD-carboxypeptidase [Lachnospiraceae bacterium]